MYKKILSLLALMIISLGFITACDKKENVTNNTSSYKINGKDVVVNLNGSNKIYFADDLLEDMLIENGVNAVVEIIFKAVVENVIEVDQTMKSNVALKMKYFDNQIKAVMEEKQLSKEDAQNSILSELGISSREEYESRIFYEAKLSRLIKEYLNNNQDQYMEDFVKEDKLYYVRHILVNSGASNYGAMADKSESDSNLKSLTRAEVSESDVEKLYRVYNNLIKGMSFIDAANHFSEDGGSKNNGGAYIMSESTPFVKEFKNGVIAFDIISKGLDIEKIDIKDKENFNLNFEEGISLIPASYIEEMYQRKSESYIIGSSTETRPRNMIFNALFANPGVSLIEVDINDEKVNPENVCSVNYAKGKESANVLCFENEFTNEIQPIFVTRGQHGIHFLTIDYSPFEEKSIDFFSLKIDKKDDFISYMETKNTSREQNEIKDELIKMYQDFYSLYQDKENEESKETYREETLMLLMSIVNEYITFADETPKEGIKTITLKNKELSKIVKDFISDKFSKYQDNVKHIKSEEWDVYFSKLNFVKTNEISKYKAPLVCLTHTSDNKVCSFSSSTGFSVIENEGEGD